MNNTLDFSNLNVLVIGDICLDIITNGECTRLSPEAPVPVIKNPIQNYFLGMAGNVALNLKKLGVNVKICTQYQADQNGNLIHILLQNEGIIGQLENIYNIVPNPNFKTITKERILANNHQIARIDIESNINNSGDFIVDRLSKYKDDEFDFIIISDYNKGLINEQSWIQIKKELERINKSYNFFVDTKKLNVELFEGMILFPNKKELNAILSNKKLKHTQNCIFELMEWFNFPLLIETLSEEGAIAYKLYDEIYSPVLATAVYDVCGAGDTFISAFSLYFNKFKNVKKALDFANYCCSKVIKKKGTTPIELSEVLDFDSKSWN